jgi:hypothetical protein
MFTSGHFEKFRSKFGSHIRPQPSGLGLNHALGAHDFFLNLEPADLLSSGGISQNSRSN